jgi:hypothetical protein
MDIKDRERQRKKLGPVESVRYSFQCSGSGSAWMGIMLPNPDPLFKLTGSGSELREFHSWTLLQENFNNHFATTTVCRQVKDGVLIFNDQFSHLSSRNSNLNC